MLNRHFTLISTKELHDMIKPTAIRSYDDVADSILDYRNGRTARIASAIMRELDNGTFAEDEPAAVDALYSLVDEIDGWEPDFIRMFEIDEAGAEILEHHTWETVATLYDDDNTERYFWITDALIGVHSDGTPILYDRYGFIRYYD